MGYGFVKQPGPGEAYLRKVLRRLNRECPPPPRGLPGELCDRLEMGILHCCDDLVPLFIDQRISLWRDRLPEVSTAINLARAVLCFLFGEYNADGDNALVLFLDVLRDRTNPENACYRRLYLLRCDLSVVLSRE